MEQKDVLTTPMSENELNSVAGGGEGETTQIHIGPGGSGGLYRCYSCGCVDFWIIGNTPTTVNVRCKSCGATSHVPQT